MTQQKKSTAKLNSNTISKPNADKALRELRDACDLQNLNDDDLNKVVGGACGWNQTKPTA